MCEAVFALQFVVLPLFKSLQASNLPLIIYGMFWSTLANFLPGTGPLVFLALSKFLFAYLYIFNFHVCCSFPSECASLLEKRSAVVLSHFELSRHSQRLNSLYIPVCNFEKDHFFEHSATWALSVSSLTLLPCSSFSANHTSACESVWDTGGGSLLHILLDLWIVCVCVWPLWKLHHFFQIVRIFVRLYDDATDTTILRTSKL